MRPNTRLEASKRKPMSHQGSRGTSPDRYGDAEGLSAHISSRPEEPVVRQDPQVAVMDEVFAKLRELEQRRAETDINLSEWQARAVQSEERAARMEERLERMMEILSSQSRPTQHQQESSKATHSRDQEGHRQQVHESPPTTGEVRNSTRMAQLNNRQDGTMADRPQRTEGVQWRSYGEMRETSSRHPGVATAGMNSTREDPRGLPDYGMHTGRQQQPGAPYTEHRRGTEGAQSSTSGDSLDVNVSTRPPSRESYEATPEPSNPGSSHSWGRRAPSYETGRSNNHHSTGVPQTNAPTTQNSTSSPGPYPYIVTRENVPHFKGEVSACEPLRRNQEIESWIRAIENIIPPNDNAYMRAARANCRGRAELIINSAAYDSIYSWIEFKGQLRRFVSRPMCSNFRRCFLIGIGLSLTLD